MRICYENRVDSAISITESTEVSGYPVENVQDQRLSKKWKTTSATSQTVVLNMASYDNIGVAAVLGHNFTSSATIVVEANNLDSWPGATSKTILYNAGICLLFFTPITYKYWKFTIDDPMSTATSEYPFGSLEIGRLWLSSYLTMDPSSLLDFQVTKKRSDRIVYGRGRQKFASIGTGWRAFQFDFPPSPNSLITSIESMIDAVGLHSSMIFCNLDTDRSYQLVEPCYCSLVNEVGFTHTERMQFNYSLALEEDL